MHVAIIMDGNGRWATERGWPRVIGHQHGVKRVEDIVRASPGLGVKALTLYAFSTENWKRSTTEVEALFKLMRMYINRKSKELLRQNVRVRFLGRRDKLSPEVLARVAHVERLTKECDGLQLNIAVDYGGRDEIVRAAKTMAEKALAGDLGLNDFTEEAFQLHTDLPDLPSPDLIIRTGGDKRLSNFMLWHAAYSEFDFLPVLWPDFKPALLEKSLDDFRSRDRRFGGVKVEGPSA
ncbi:polyprenyl diphosphate synthase [Pelagovum sp. HNIBRBA483]|uniref:polyprenyl diphosphate synthase n=1 Tax=Pelagovum sp. HNIBRBA483 TaxID=3233341 RepID=UPI0034A0FBCE